MCCKDNPSRWEENAISKGMNYLEMLLLLDKEAAARVEEYLIARYEERIHERFGTRLAPLAD